MSSPPQVLKLVSIPEAVAAAGAASAHGHLAPSPPAVHRPSQPQQRAKRKRGDEPPDEPDPVALAIGKGEAESGAVSSSAVQRAAEEAAELRGVVEWCRHRLVWGVLLLQLRVPPQPCCFAAMTTRRRAT